MYSKLNELQKKTSLKVQDGVTLGCGITEQELSDMIIDFCGSSQNVVGLVQGEVLDLFEEYCKENGLPKVNRLTAGRMMCKALGITRKKARFGKELKYIYVIDKNRSE